MDKVLVSIKTKHRLPDGTAENIHMSAQGQYAFKGGKHYIRYVDEKLLEHSAIPTTIKLCSDEIVLIRQGVISGQQRFVPEQETKTIYRTQYGNLEIDIATEWLTVEFNQGGGQGRLKYRLRMNGEAAGDYDMVIKVKRL